MAGYCQVTDNRLFVCVHVFQKLKHTESDKLQVQIQAYLDNVFDVGALLEDAETKNAALERVEELEENMSHVSALDLIPHFNASKLTPQSDIPSIAAC